LNINSFEGGIMNSVMRKLALVSMLVASTTYAATTGTLTLTGTISQNVSIVVNTLAAAGTLDLTATQTNLAVANVDEVSNSAGGYKITASSANAGTIKNGANADNVAYTLKYDGGSAISLTVAPQDMKTGAGGIVTDNSAVTISYTGAAGLSSGTYSDTVTFTIVAL
jgi:hypothetical protein